jgi:hypothetical protein
MPGVRLQKRASIEAAAFLNKLNGNGNLRLKFVAALEKLLGEVSFAYKGRYTSLS